MNLGLPEPRRTAPSPAGLPLPPIVGEDTDSAALRTPPTARGNRILGRDETLLVSDFSPSRLPPAVREHVLAFARNPDQGSIFSTKAWFCRTLPPGITLWSLRFLGYDGVLFPRGDVIRGHVFFQRHDTALHVFSVWVADPLRGSGLGTALVRSFVEHALCRPEIDRVRIGGGGDPQVVKIFHRLRGEFSPRGIEGDERFFLTFPAAEHRSKERMVTPPSSTLP